MPYPVNLYTIVENVTVTATSSEDIFNSCDFIDTPENRELTTRYLDNLARIDYITKSDGQYFQHDFNMGIDIEELDYTEQESHEKVWFMLEVDTEYNAHLDALVTGAKYLAQLSSLPSVSNLKAEVEAFEKLSHVSSHTTNLIEYRDLLQKDLMRAAKQVLSEEYYTKFYGAY